MDCFHTAAQDVVVTSDCLQGLGRPSSCCRQVCSAAAAIVLPLGCPEMAGTRVRSVLVNERSHCRASDGTFGDFFGRAPAGSRPTRQCVCDHACRAATETRATAAAAFAETSPLHCFSILIAAVSCFSIAAAAACSPCAVLRCVDNVDLETREWDATAAVYTYCAGFVDCPDLAGTHATSAADAKVSAAEHSHVHPLVKLRAPQPTRSLLVSTSVAARAFRSNRDARNGSCCDCEGRSAAELCNNISELSRASGSLPPRESLPPSLASARCAGGADMADRARQSVAAAAIVRTAQAA